MITERNKMTTTRFKNWKTTKDKRKSEKVLDELSNAYPHLHFHVFTRQWEGKDKTSYTIRTIERKGEKRK